MRVACGGRGGLGNFSVSDYINIFKPFFDKKKDLQARRLGEKGERKEIELRLKMIADVGFIGFPNAGKSTLLAAVRLNV